MKITRLFSPSESDVPEYLGRLSLTFEDGNLVTLEIGARQNKRLAKNSEEISSYHQVSNALESYFQNQIEFNKTNNIPGLSRLKLDPQGTAFQKAVWQELMKIPGGEVRTYKDIALKLGSSPRAVGNACRQNPIPILIPCHRVVSVSGPGGYAGKTAGREMQIKKWLLMHEGVNL